MPVRALGFVFLALVGVTAAEATQAVGALLLLGLLAAPGRRRPPAHHPTLHRRVALGRDRGLSMWIGLSISYAAPKVPPSFAIIAVATGAYTAAIVATT